MTYARTPNGNSVYERRDTKWRKTAANKDLVRFSCCAIMNAKFTLALQHGTSAVYLLKWLWSIIHTEFQCRKEIVYLQTTDNKIVKKKAEESSASEHTHTRSLIQNFLHFKQFAMKNNKYVAFSSFFASADVSSLLI